MCCILSRTTTGCTRQHFDYGSCVNRSSTSLIIYILMSSDTADRVPPRTCTEFEVLFSFIWFICLEWLPTDLHYIADMKIFVHYLTTHIDCCVPLLEVSYSNWHLPVAQWLNRSVTNLRPVTDIRTQPISREKMPNFMGFWKKINTEMSRTAISHCMEN